MLLFCALQQLLLSNAVLPNARSKFLTNVVLALQLFYARIQFLMDCVSFAGGMQVKEYTLADELPMMQEFRHYVVFSSLAADTPAQQKWLQCMAHNGRLPCRACTIHGVQFETQKADGTVSVAGMYVPGYNKKTEYGECSLLCLLHGPVILIVHVQLSKGLNFAGGTSLRCRCS